MLAEHLLTQILDAHLQIPTASRAFLHKIRAAWHSGISCYRRLPHHSVLRRLSINAQPPRINDLEPVPQAVRSQSRALIHFYLVTYALRKRTGEFFIRIVAIFSWRDVGKTSISSNLIQTSRRYDGRPSDWVRAMPVQNPRASSLNAFDFATTPNVNRRFPPSLRRSARDRRNTVPNPNCPRILFAFEGSCEETPARSHFRSRK